MNIFREFVRSFYSKLMSLAPYQRRMMLIAADALLLPLTVWFSFWLRLAHPFHVTFQSVGFWLIPAVLLIGLPLYAFTG